MAHNCCSNIAGQIVHDENEVRRLARKASPRHSKGLSTVAVEIEIAAAKSALAETKRRQVDHEAEHAQYGDNIFTPAAS